MPCSFFDVTRTGKGGRPQNGATHPLVKDVIIEGEPDGLWRA
jgi:hypothetical protein